MKMAIIDATRTGTGTRINQLVRVAAVAGLFVLPLQGVRAQDAPAKPKAQVMAVAAELETKLDTKSCKAGDVVSAKLVEDGNLKGVMVPKGSKLTGKIVEAGKGRLILLFDGFEVKKAGPAPTHAALISVAPPIEDPGYNDPGMQHGSVAENAQYSGTSADGAYAHPSALAAPSRGSSIKGVDLVTGMTPASSGTLSSGKDFKLEKGTRLWVALW